MNPFFCRLFFSLFLGFTGVNYAQKLEAVVQRGHFESVKTEDEQLLATGSWDGTAKIWNIATGELITSLTFENSSPYFLQFLKNEQGPVHSLAASKDGRYLVAGTHERVLMLWDLRTQKVLQTLTGHQSPVTSICFNPDQTQVISCSQDGVIKVWDIATGNELFSHIVMGEKDRMVKDSHGYFNATEGARTAISFVKGMESYAVDQFFEEFYHPVLLQNIYKQQSLPDKRSNLLDKLEKSPPPKVEILVPHDGATINDQVTDLMVKVTNRGGGIAGLKVMQTIYALKSYLDDQVPEYSLKFRGKPQHPYTFSRGHDSPLIIFK